MLGKIFRTLVVVALLPVSVAKDVVTLGGAATGETTLGFHSTADRLEKIEDDLDEIA